MKNALIIILLCTLLSCSKNRVADPPVMISFDMGKKNSFKLSDFCDSVAYIPLETKAESLMGTVNKLKLSENVYYFSTGSGQDKIIGFDKKSGKHVLTINKNGKGPGEYIGVFDFNVDPDNNSIEIYSRGSMKLLTYNTEGHFRSEKKVEEYFTSFFKYGDSYYFEAEIGENLKGIFYDPGDLESQIKILETADYDAIDVNSFSSFNDTVSFGCSYNKYIYHLVNGRVVNKYEYNFEGHNIPDIVFEQHFASFIELKNELKARDCAYSKYSCFESSGFIVTTVIFRGKRHVAIYCKKTGHSLLANELIEDLYGTNEKMEIFYGFMPFALDNNELLFLLEAPVFKKMLDSKLKNSLNNGENPKPLPVGATETISDNDNPVLMKLILKNF